MIGQSDCPRMKVIDQYKGCGGQVMREVDRGRGREGEGGRGWERDSERGSV